MSGVIDLFPAAQRQLAPLDSLELRNARSGNSGAGAGGALAVAAAMIASISSEVGGREGENERACGIG